MGLKITLPARPPLTISSDARLKFLLEDDDVITRRAYNLHNVSIFPCYNIATHYSLVNSSAQ